MNRAPWMFLVIPMAAGAADYTFQKIADDSAGTTLGFYNDTRVAINAQGEVAFRAFRTTDGRGTPLGDLILKSTGGPHTVIADYQGNFRTLAMMDINSSGTVLFTAQNRDIVTTGLYTGAGGQVTTITTSATEPQFSPLAVGTFNDSGTVAFTIITGIRVFSNGTFRTISGASALTSAMGQINRDGTVAFLVPVPAGLELSTDRNGTVTRVAPDVTNLRISAPLPPAINDRGTAALIGVTTDLPPRWGVWLVEDGRYRQFANAGPGTISAVNINNSGTIAYTRAGDPSAPNGIYVGPDPAADRVIGIGDTLFGARVTSVSVAGPGHYLNDRGQIAFYYTLANLTKGVAVATPAAASPTAPVLAAGAIVNAATLVTTPAASPGSVVSLFGERFSPDLQVASGSSLPTALGGTTVTFDGMAAPLYFVSPNQINAQVPIEVTSATTLVQVRTAGGQSEIRTLPVNPVSPGIYTLSQAGTGQGIVTFAGTATLVAPRGLTPDSRPAKAGDILTIYATGFGTVTPAIRSGENSCGGVCRPDGSNLVLRNAVLAPTVEIGGVLLSSADILFAGLAPEFVGLFQLNLRVPGGIAPNPAAPITLRQGTTTSRTGVTIAVE